MDTDSRLKLFLRKVWFGPLTGCWHWTGALRTWSKEPWDGGYGAFWDGEKVVRAHVWLYQRLIGEIPAGQVLLHDCDNRKCVNVASHIYPGTQKQNVQDMIKKGRASFFRKSS